MTVTTMALYRAAAVVPEAALNGGLVVMAIGVGWTVLWLLARSHRLAPANHAPAEPRRTPANGTNSGSFAAHHRSVASAARGKTTQTEGSR